MIDFSRRRLMASSAVLSAHTLLGSPLLAAARTGRVPQEAAAPPLSTPAVAPRERLLFDFGWRFALGHGSDPTQDFGFGYGQADFAKTGSFKIAKAEFDDSGWRLLDLPHDWAVELPFVHDDSGEGDSRPRSHGYRPLGRRYPETSVGWYRRTFDIPAEDLGRRIWVEFDGALRDVVVLVNGCFVGRNDNGYAPFAFDLTDFLNYGGRNFIAVRADASFGDGWFYEGAGLYRHLWLTKTDSVHLGRWESVVRSEVRSGETLLELATVVENDGESAVAASVEWTILDPSGREVARVASADAAIPPNGSAPIRVSATIPAPRLWSPQTPYIYAAVARVRADGRVRDAEQVDFGVRTIRFDADKGFFLNGSPLKIMGTCNHHDHAGVGAAVPDALQWFRLSILRDMGSNAVRTSHNMPTPEWVAACDRMGMMMLCETRQMSSNPEGLEQLEVMLKRYRNSPSIIAWSIGNEEWLLQAGDMAPQGARIARTLVERCHALDPTRPVTAAVNGNNEQGVTEPLDLVGFNYNENLPDEFHRKHPERPVLGTEVSSAISTRGEYSTDPARNTVSSYDGVVPWGKTPEEWWTFYATREWLAGGFAWTGFDYRGEPTPYSWPSVSSQFGIVDLCGFPKDYYHYYRAWWGQAPALHLFPHWDWAGREGQSVSVWVYSNCDEVELFVNGKSAGRKPVPRHGHVEWSVPYQPGAIEARGYTRGRESVRQRRETTSAPRAIRVTSDRPAINADREDLAILTFEVLDGKGRSIPTAGQKLAFRIEGPGLLIGVGNGDPNCLESDKGDSRSLFNGLAQAIVRSTGDPGEIVVEAVAAAPAFDVLLPGRTVVEARPCRRRAAVSTV